MVPLDGGETEHALGMHIDRLDTPKSHDVSPMILYPRLHCGWHDAPWSNTAGHVPAVPLVGGVIGQGSSMQTAVVSKPAVHDISRASLYPFSHLGRHDSACCNSDVQVPMVPWIGGAEMWHDLGMHAGVPLSVPALHKMGPGEDE